ncbi:uncharacterized protein LOC126895253 [Daktulosphaira vitifoliae]|uniref:uncharacterized protein LOC126895253 n=1 Tax=Daktulosphaira vitifoliae TaxID=58002 RepID=UPI0021A9E5B2|nr:uncharacterized protein LOC126895253 [Daktulosphaira vitifoliae]
MSHSYHNSVPKISVTTYESVEENVEVNNYFNSQKIRNNFNSNVTTLSSNPSQRKINVDWKSMTSEDSNLKHSLSPISSSDINCLTDIEAISDSDDENNFIQTGCLSPSLQKLCILTDIEDLSEDERLSSVNKINEVHTDTENFSDELDYLKNELKEKKYIEDFFPQPHREVSFHSKDSIICTLTPTNEINPVWLKSPREELEGFESEEEIVTIPENYNDKSCKGNSDIYHHDNYSGVVESSEFIKKYQNKQKSCVLMTNKKSFLSDADFIKKRVRNKRQNSSDKRENFEKKSTESLKTELKSLLTPSLNNIMQSTGLQLNNKNYANKRHPEYNNLNKLVIHDNINGFSVSFNFENQNSVILNIGRDSENLSLKWYKNGSASGSEVNLSQYQNEKSLSCSEPSTEITTNAISILYQNSIDKIPPKPNPRYSIDISTALSLDEDNTNYSTKKQFWEEKSKSAYQPPLPKPRHSISLPVNPNERSIMKNSSLDLNCTSFDTSDHAEISEMIKKPLMSNQTTNNFVVNDSTCQQIKGIDDMPKSITLENHSYKARPINRLDSEAEYIQKYGEESLAYENQGFQEDDLNDVNSTKHIQSLEESTLKNPINKEITSNQYIEQIKPQILSMQMEQEFSPEHKSLKNITNKNSLSQEVLINRQIHKHIFSNELDEQIDSLIPEVKHFKVNSETDFSTDLLINKYVEKSSSISEKSITKTESNESSTIDDLPEEKINKNANIISKYSSSLSQDLIDEIPLDTCSKIEQSEKNKLQTEYISSSLNKDLQHEYVINPIEETKKVHIIHTPEEHIQDTIWEVTQIRSDSQDIIENVNTRKQEEFQNKSVKQDNILELTEISKNDMTNNLAKDIAEQLVNEIEIELTKRQDVLANLQHLVVSPEHLKQLENNGYLDIDGDDLKIKLIESVLAKKSREQLKNISKNDTVTSSIEITDEDLKSSGFEIEYDGFTKLPIINDIIIDHKNNKSDEKTIPENLNCQSEIFNHNDNEKNSNALNNEVLIHCHLKNVNNEETLTEISQNCEVFSTGQITHDSSSQKNHRDISIDVSERITLNTDIKQIDNHEKGSYIKIHDDELFHDIIKYSETKLCENSIILQQRASELEINRIDTSECFDIESEVQETDGKNSIKTKQKYVDTKLRDFDKIVKKESEEHEEISDNGSTIISNTSKESHIMSNILIETCSKSKNEISLKDEQICSPISNSPLVKHLSTESLPSKDNSIHSPTSPSSSSIDIREEKHVNFDSVTLRKPDSVNIMKLTAKRPADSSSSESHYQSFDLTSSSRPCSSDVDGLLACSSEYESAISVPSNEYHTAISSLSSRESMKSLDSESSGNLASVENSEASETLIASTGDLDYDIEVPNDILEEDIKIESYEQKIPMQIIRGESLPLIAETSDKKYSSIYKTQPFSQPTINSENNAQKMKRSHEMTFHPVPKHITSDSLSDSSSHEEKQYSSESMSISSTEGPAIQTVVETTNGYPKSVISSFSLSDDSATLAEKSTTTNKDNKYLKEEELNQDVTILSSSLVENETLHNVSTQITSKFEEVQKKGHRRSISSVNEIVFEGINLNSSKEIDLKDSSNEIITSKQCDQSLYNILTKTTSIETKKCENILDLGKNIDVTSICKHSDSGKLTSPISEKHSFEHIDDVAEADAAFQMVPHVSPVIPTSLPPTIPEDPFSEDEDDLIEDTSNNVPNIMVTEHMAPLIDHGFCYPDLDLEAKELEIKSTPETPASISSKESSDTDQGKEYVLNNNFNPHEESSCTLKEHIALEKVEKLVEKDSISLGESFEIIENNEEIPNLEEEFVIVDEIDKDIKCQLINIEGTEDKNLHSSIISDNTIIQESDIDKEYSNLNWVELQFDDDNTVNEIFGYNMEYDRPPLEDIKEEDTEDLHSSKVGSVGSQVSQSIGSFGSMKESFSSTPESKKYLGKSLEHDNLSINSLQEFERLEQLVRIESMQAKSSGSLASNTSSSSNSRKEDNSLGSLKDFEAIEAACIQTEMIENKALESEKLLINNESVFKIYDIGQISDFHVEQNEEISEKLHSDDDNLTSTDSLDLKTIVTDIKPSISAERIFVESISAEFDDCMNSSISSRDFSSSLIDDHSKESSNRDSLILGSNDSLGPSSSTATNATYHCETGSNLSSSFTSGGSNTMVSSMEGLDKAGIKNEWFEGSEFIETQEKDHDDTKYVHRIIKIPAEIHKVSAKGLEKVGTLDDFVEKFNPEVYEDKIEHTDEFGNTVTVKKMQKRMIFETKEELNKGISKEELNECLRKLSDNISDQYEYSNATANNFQGPTEENQVVSNISTLNVELQRDATKSELKYEISMDDDTEIDLREHDWRFQHQIKNESDDVTKPGPSESAVKTKSKETVSEL